MDTRTTVRHGTDRAFLRWCVPVLVCMAIGSSAIAADWPQWGGPDRDFKVSATGLAQKWPVDGPKRLWEHSLGEGFSGIAAKAGKLYTMYREGDDEIIIALDSETGKTVWEHRCEATPHPDQTTTYGQGPSATPLVLGDRVVTVGFTGLMHCLDIKTGDTIWSHDLVEEFGAPYQYYGYSNSPLLHKGAIITLVGGERYGVVALNPKDGKPVWRSKPCEVSYASPVLINVDGQDQVVFFSPTEVVGMDPGSGAFLWRHPVVNFCKVNCTSVIWGKDNLLWVATKGVGGTRVLKLAQQGGKTKVEEVWMNRKIRVFQWNAIRVGDYVYTSSGDAKTFLSAIDIKTGEVVDRQRGFGATNQILADGRVILLDDGGKLALAKVSPKGIEIVSSAQVLDALTWTVPTLVDKTLFVRDRGKIIALDLS